MTDVQTDALDVLVDIETERSIHQFLYLEAELLDDTRYVDWFETVFAEDLWYVIPTRTTRERRSSTTEFSGDSFHLGDTWRTLKVRVDRLLTEHAWAEDPASRTRRYVTNIRILAADDGQFLVKSNLALYRSQWDTADYDLLSAERHDVMRRVEGKWKISRRTVYLSHTILGTPNLGVFL